MSVMAGQALVRRYDREFALVYGSFGWAATAALGAALVLAPLWLQGYFLYVASLIGTNVVVVVGLDLLVGFAGQISLGQAGFVAVGAYATALLSARADVPFWLALPTGALLAGVVGWLVGLPALRLKGPYLAIATMGFGIAVQQALINWPLVSGGRSGLMVPAPRMGPWSLASDTARYYVVLAVASALGMAAYNIRRSYVGRAWMALRDSDLAAQTNGVDMTRYKTLAFAVSAAYAGAAGGLTSLVLGYLEPNLFSFLESIYYLALAVVGGLGTVSGPILGAALLTALPQLASRTREYLPVLYGAVVLAVMAIEPWGLYGRWLRIKRYFKTWPL
ncbi:MAG: branched-chain amino acid ABC transporter permease [Firmicutes bacterium]|nr:branched-chain amino acid ABC transporter permease [Bacillota bacterium]